jgi:hypothetical protein
MSSPYIDATGINIETLTEIINDIINGTPQLPGLIQIYGPDINVDSNTPDGEWINIFGLSNEDIQQLCVQIYDSFDPTQAVGVALDGLCQLNSSSLLRKGGIYTQVVVDVVVSETFNLSGLDTSSPFTISDANGNLFYLISSSTVSATTNPLNFQAANIGFIQVLPNTLTVPVTIVAGVVSVNNPSSPYQIGSNQETDSQLRIRRAASTAMPAQGFNASLYAGLLSIPGLTQATIYENTTTVNQLTVVPPASIWVIVEGGSSTEVADMIYTYRNAGCGMYGSTSVSVLQADGSSFIVNFSPAVDLNLYLSLTVSSLSGGSIDTTALASYLATNYNLGIYEVADITSITALIHAYSTDILVQFAGVNNTNSGYVDSIFPTNRYNIWVLPAANIAINVV